jgi:hypothetical protein
MRAHCMCSVWWHASVRSTEYTMQYTPRVSSAHRQGASCVRGVPPVRNTDSTMQYSPRESSARRPGAICVLGMPPVRSTWIHIAIVAASVVCAPLECLLCDWYATVRKTEYTMECSQRVSSARRPSASCLRGMPSVRNTEYTMQYSP